MGKKIGIIGAGISGLLACKYAMQKEGLSPMIFESRKGIGGVWSETMESTKLQTPKQYYQFSDFEWPNSVSDDFPRGDQVKDYIESYAIHFNIFPQIKFHCKVLCIDYIIHGEEDDDPDLWGGTGHAFSSTGKWNITVQDTRHPMEPPQVYQVDFVILCTGKFSDVPNIPHFPLKKGAEVFNGEVIHYMDYAAMDNETAAQFIKNKRVTVVGFQKSAVDVAHEVAKTNGARYPCTLLFRTVHWTVPENLLKHSFRNMNRFAELMIHKPHEGFFLWFVALIFSPLLWIFSKLVETYLKCIYPLKKYKMVPDHGFFRQISSCKFTVLPTKFYDRVADGSLILKKSKSMSFHEKGVIVNDEADPIETDIVIFSTGYQSDQKLSQIFASTHFQKYITKSSTPLYRECIHPRIPQLAILGYSESPAILYTTEMRSKWLGHFLGETKMKLPSIRQMEDETMKWEKCIRRYGYKSSCVSVLLQIYCNDQICRDMGFSPRRKTSFLSELFAPYAPSDYSELH